jgi:FixJ family two-component response regulator
VRWMTNPFLIGIVDDDYHVRASLADLLRAGGYGAACYGTAEDFLDAKNASECAAIVADIHMPGMSGIELLERLAPILNSLPVVVMTGQPEDTWRDRALQAGAAGFVQKPFPPKGLLALLAETIQSSRLGRSTGR